MTFKLRPYQADCIENIVAKGRGNWLVQMATGLGKSITFSRIPRQGKMLILSHRDELVTQPLKYFECKTGIEKGKEISHGEEVVSASVQSMANRLDRFSKDEFDIIVVDECFSGDVNILTEKGWYRFDELPKNIKIMQYNVKTKKTSYAYPEKYIVNAIDGEIVNFTSNRFGSLKVTKKHRMYLNDSFVMAKDASKSHKYRTSGEATGCQDKLTENERIQILYQADGCNQNRKRYFTIQLTKGRKIKRLLDLCDKADVIISEIKTKRLECKRYGISTKFNFSKNLFDIFDVSKLSCSKCIEIIEEMVHWDGHVNNKNSYYYSSVVKANADFYQIVALQAGYNAQISIQKDNRKEKFKDVYRLFITKNKKHKTLQSFSIEKEKYKNNAI